MFSVCTCKVALKCFSLFSKAVKKDQHVILVVSLFPIILFIIARLVGSPGVEEVLGIVEELTDLTTSLVVNLTELDGQPTDRGGRLTSLDASFMRCFGFFQTSSKTSRSMFFSKHR